MNELFFALSWHYYEKIADDEKNEYEKWKLAEDEEKLKGSGDCYWACLEE